MAAAAPDDGAAVDTAVDAVVEAGEEGFVVPDEATAATLTAEEEAAVQEMMTRMAGSEVEATAFTPADDELCSPGLTQRQVATRYLMSRSFDVDVALQLRRNYIKVWHRHDVGAVSQEEMDKLLDPPRHCGRSPLTGAFVVYMDKSLFFPEQYTVPGLLAAMLKQYHDLLRSSVSQRCGHIMVVEMRNFSWENWSLKLLKVFADAFQSTLPVRMKAFYIMHPPWYVGTLIKMVSPFLSAKMRGRIHVLHSYEELLTATGVTKQQLGLGAELSQVGEDAGEGEEGGGDGQRRESLAEVEAAAAQ
jgi:hypothetical protein